MVRALLCCAFALSAACTAPGPRLASLPETELLSGSALAVAPRAGTPLLAETIFELDDTMQAFVAAHTGNLQDPAAKLRRLLIGMKERGFFALEYDETLTRTARETFYELEGNCLSFTILFVALARAAGLDATYQAVEMPPGWSREADLVIVTNHINALVETRSGQSFVVDFNLAGFQSERKRRLVDDAHVLALFYSNLGAEALIRKDYETSFRYLRAAIAADDEVADAWVNLGVLYRRQGHLRHAEASYLHALSAEPRDGSALTNLANLQKFLGNHAAAAEYQELIRRHQQRNPYYHHFRAREAFAQQRFDDALAAVKQAVRLKRDEPAFHELRARAKLELERRAAAPADDDRARYTDAAAEAAAAPL